MRANSSLPVTTDPRIVFVFTGHGYTWDVPNALATDGAGNWFVCNVSYSRHDDETVPREDCKPVSLREAIAWYLQCESFSCDSMGTLEDFLKDVAKVLPE
jgi:hypothetical protein